MAWRFLGEPVETPYFIYLGMAEHTVRKLEPECPDRQSMCREGVPVRPQPSGCESTLWPVQDPGLMREAP